MAPTATTPEYHASSHDVVIVGAGVAGSALAYALAEDGRNVALLERDLSEPDRIVGELMQPGGCLALEKLGLADTLDNMDAIDVHGYVVVDKDETCHLVYPDLPSAAAASPSGSADPLPARGKSFHHGRFIMNLRRKCLEHPNISVVQATATDLIRDLTEPRILGVHAIARGTSSTPASSDSEPAPAAAATERHLEFLAPLTVVADGCFSKFRKEALGTAMQAPSHFVGLILHDVPLPAPNHGHVVLADPSPILLYQIGTHDTRILVDVPGSKLPSNRNGELSDYLRSHVAPQLPASVQPAFFAALESQRLRIMPNPYLPPSRQGDTPGLLLLGDAHNMRHPLTGGGMSVALNDVVILRRLLNKADFPTFAPAHNAAFRAALASWYWERKRLSSVINILANALYSLFSAGDDRIMGYLRRATFDYLRLGGECTAAPVRLLACLSPEPLLLVRHFFQVAAYGAWHLLRSEPIWALPRTLWRQARVMAKAVNVIGPLCWYELRGAPRTLSAIAARNAATADAAAAVKVKSD
ncbi:Squalene epoxidase [Blastocladiella emersonii ATCC 22665]|nr:Squalene epoxidase [Blastocladiella emersonii ATCC 22665]